MESIIEINEVASSRVFRTDYDKLETHITSKTCLKYESIMPVWTIDLVVFAFLSDHLISLLWFIAKNCLHDKSREMVISFQNLNTCFNVFS